MAELTPEQKRALIAERQNTIRLRLHDDRIHHPAFEGIARINSYGTLMERRWYAIAAVAIINRGSLLGTDTQYEALEKEIREWPSLLWISLLGTPTFFQQAKRIYPANRNKLGITSPGNPPTIAEAGWVPGGIRGITKMEVWQWLGYIGGEMPPVPADPKPPGE